MTYSHTQDTTTCNTCGDYIINPWGPVLAKFEAGHECSERVAA